MTLPMGVGVNLINRMLHLVNVGIRLCVYRMLNTNAICN